MRKVFVLLIMVAVYLVSPGYTNAQGMLQIKGSDTLVNIVQRLSEVYMEVHPEKFIAVTGGGSGTGIASLTNGKCDIANSSRDMKEKEVTQAKERGVDVQHVVIAMDGLSVITHPENPIKKLTIDELGKIFRGEVTNWKDIGGTDAPVTLYGRQSNSGTFVFFREAVLKGDYSQKMNRMNGNAQILEAVKKDKSGIGYVGVGYLKNATGLTVLSVAAKHGADYTSPLNNDDVVSGKYPIVRPLNQYLNGTPKGDVKAFIDFELSAEGQKIVAEEGFFPVTAEHIESNKKALGN
ncbi:PstS family phosphate ABC transporter substrate-binding protein [Thermodesulfobacteriota bacterium]